MEARPDVLIAGAGPTGLTLACGLLAAGVDAHVVDKADGPAGTSRALGLQPRGIEVVDRLGALDGLPERALQVEQVVVHINGKHTASVRVGQRTALVTRPGLVISQAEVEGELRRRVAELGGQIAWGCPVAAAEQDAHGVTVTLADGTQSRPCWLVGCDGAHSRVRELAGIGFPGVPLAERFLLADVHAHLLLSRSAIYAWLEGDSVFGIFPLPGRDVWRLMAPAVDPGAGPGAGPSADSGAGSDRMDRMTAGAVLAEVVRLLGERTSCDPSQIDEAEWVTSFRVHRRIASTYRSGRILLAGDAAHVFSPFGSQGMNTGIGDAENLAWKLAMVVDGTAEPVLLDSYEAERRPAAAKLLRSTGAASKLVLGNHLLARLLRDRVVVPLMGKLSVQRRVWENLSQLKVTYRNGPLGHRARRRFSRRGPLPGDRVPDLPCVRDRDGEPTTLHAELGDRWALVTPGPMASDELAIVVGKRLGDDNVTVLIAEGTPNGDTMLLRPDAHLAWRGRATSAALDRCLTAMTQHGRIARPAGRGPVGLTARGRGRWPRPRRG